MPLPMVACRLIVALSLCLLLSGCQSQRAGMMWLHAANQVARLGAYEAHEDLVYGEHARHRLDVFVPRSAGTRPQPVVIFFHGGDWSEGYPGKEAHRFVADALTSRGLVTVIPNYRRYPDVRFPAFVQDAADAVVWTHRHIASFGGDPDRLIVMGHSAGAHLASMVALNDRYLREAGGRMEWIAGLIGMAGPYSFLPMPDDPLLKDLFGPPERYGLSQVVNYVDGRRNPPMLLIGGADDERVPLICLERMERRVLDTGGEVRTEVYEGLDHIMLIASLARPIRWYRRDLIRDIGRFAWEVYERHPGATPPVALPLLVQSEALPPLAGRDKGATVARSPRMEESDG